LGTTTSGRRSYDEGYTLLVATLLLFIDGIGIGHDDPEDNPFAVEGIERLAPLSGRAPRDGVSFRALDATLGVAGLPQSATGQTTLFTGVNAAKAIGAHHPGLPGPTLQAILREESLFTKLVGRGARPTFANAFTRRHLDAERPRFGATTHMAMASGVRLRLIEEDDERNETLSHDYTGDWMTARGYPVKQRTARDAARVLSGLLTAHELVLYEYFLTDLAAHRGTREQRFEQARRVEALLDATLATVDLASHRVVVVSDHGNLEESGHDRHTRNDVPLLAWGRGAKDLVDAVDRMETLTPALVDLERGQVSH
jgi:2,3-bisphosphoglycerate-independent phosphoglycerate mutase